MAGPPSHNQLTIVLGQNGLAADAGGGYRLSLNRSLRDVKQILITGASITGASSANIMLQFLRTTLRTVMCVGNAGQPSDGIRMTFGAVPLSASTTLTTVPNTTIAAGSNGAALPQATINVAAASTFPTSGTIQITLASGATTLVSYTGTGATTFTGCTGGSGTLATGNAVIQALPTATLNVAATASTTAVFPSAGNVQITLSSGATTIVNYTGVTATTLTGCTGGSGTLATGNAVALLPIATVNAAAYFGTPIPLLDYAGRQNTTLDGEIMTLRVVDWSGAAVTFTQLTLMGLIVMSTPTPQVPGNATGFRDAADSYPRTAGWN
jgi:hypothetical protein